MRIPRWLKEPWHPVRRRLSRASVRIVALLLVGLLGPTTAQANEQAPNYGEALQKSIYFYEAQQSGVLPSWNRVPWRGNATELDGSDVGLDLSGGWYDAGDHVKFGLPMAASATLLAWGVIENPQAYQGSGQMVHIKNNLRFVADYFVAAHPQPNLFYGQVGNGHDDHGWWGPVEVLEDQNHEAANRPAHAISEQCPGSDLAGETAAALAAISMVFADDDPTYAATLLSHSEQLYAFADSFRGKYSDCITDAQSFYRSWSGYQDELVWSAAWLYRATRQQAYLDAAESHYQSMNKGHGWTHAWDDKSYGSFVLLAQLTGDSDYESKAQNWLDYWSTGYNGSRVNYTPGGLAQLDQWGANRYAANTAFIALVYADYLANSSPGNSRIQTYYDFAVGQMEYLLGDNPMGHPYQIGLSDVGPINPHHRTAHGSWSNSISSPTNNRHLLVGALVGGPGNGDSYIDDRSDYIANEVAVDYNAGFTSALARLYLDFGGAPIPEDQFPVAETPDDELLIEAKYNSVGADHVQISAFVHNRTAWPARVTDNLTLRYWVDLHSEISAGYSASDVTVTLPYEQGATVGSLTAWGDPADQLYYVDVSFAGTDIYPGNWSTSRKEVQLRFQLPSGANAWDNSADPSWDAYSSSHYIQTNKIALYEGTELVWGIEPSPGCGSETGINCLPVAQSLTVTTDFEVPVQVTLAGDDSDGHIIGYQISSPASKGTLDLSGSSLTYQPNSGFFGEDAFSYQAIDDQSALSEPATVSIKVNQPIIPAVTITAPANGSQHLVDSELMLTFDYVHAASLLLKLNGTPIESGLTGNSATIRVPADTGSFVIELITEDQAGQLLSGSDSITLEALPNQAPVAEFSVTTQGLQLSLDASASYDPDPQTLSYHWDFGDGETLSTSTATANHSYTSAGSYQVTLTLSDGQAIDTLSKTVSVEAPSAAAVCQYQITKEWSSGWNTDVSITNVSSETIQGWQLFWQYQDGSTLRKGWSATLGGIGTSAGSATPLSWNYNIAPGETKTFGFTSDKVSSGDPVTALTLSGDVCQ